MTLLDATFCYDEAAHDPSDGDRKRHAAAVWEDFRGGMLTERQRRVLRQHSPKRRGEPVAFDSTGLRLADGSHVDAHVVVWATGYSTGLGELQFVRDGQPVALDTLRDQPLFQHCIVPMLPTVVIASHFFISQGPLRGHALAEYLTHHLCVRPRVEEDVMAAVARTNTVLTPLDRGIIFSPGYTHLLAKLVNDMCTAYVVERDEAGVPQVEPVMSYSSAIGPWMPCMLREGQIGIQSVLDLPNWMVHMTRLFVWRDSSKPIDLTLLPDGSQSTKVRAEEDVEEAR